jgi:hypothetical protein
MNETIQRRTDRGPRRTLIDETTGDAGTDLSGSTVDEAPRLRQRIVLGPSSAGERTA